MKITKEIPITISVKGTKNQFCSKDCTFLLNKSVSRYETISVCTLFQELLQFSTTFHILEKQDDPNYGDYLMMRCKQCSRYFKKDQPDATINKTL